MTQSNQPSDQTVPLLPTLATRDQLQLLRVFWIASSAILAYEFFWAESLSILSNISAVILTIASLTPFYLWCSGRAKGMPIYPVFALTFLWTYALPFVTKHPKVQTYPPESHFAVSIIVSGSLLFGTFIWFQFVKNSLPKVQEYRALNANKGIVFFQRVIVVAILFHMSNVGRWWQIDPGIYSIIRGVILGLSTLAFFVLAYRFGTQELSRRQEKAFVFLLAVHMIVTSVSLLLISAATVFLTSMIAFTIGRRKVPILLIAFVFVLLSVLHSGKNTMRDYYWKSAKDISSVQPWNYPAYYSEWLGYSLTNLNLDPRQQPSKYKSEPFLERSSIVQMLLLAHKRSPQSVPYLAGKTYSILPELLVPRILNSSKIRSHEGTFILSIHYGLQKQKDTLSTTIAWGLMAESYANFGVLGCFGLTGFLGIFYGWVTRWSLGTSILSSRSLFVILLMTFAFQAEWSAGVYVATLFQSSAALGGIVIFLMEPYREWTVPSFPGSRYA
jgi:hypothetical protein